MKFLFYASYADGSSIEQTPADVSTINPEKSEFFDVLERAKTTQLAWFSLSHEEQTWTVDLRDGSFSYNGARFNIGDPLVQLPAGTKYELFYARRHTHTMSSSSLEEQSHTIEFLMGYTATVDGKTIRQTVQLR